MPWENTKFVLLNMGLPNCYKCEKQFDADIHEHDIFTCDRCDFDFHLKCAKAKREEVEQRKTSKCLRIYCPNCICEPAEFVEKKLVEATKLLYKIDLFNQERKPDFIINNANINTIVKKINTIESKVEKLEANSNGCVQTVNQHTKNSFASVVKQPQPAVVVKPKQKQKCKQTLDEITKSVDKSELNVRNTRNVREGGVVLCCKNATETMKVKQVVRDKLGENYEVILPEVKHPRLRITNIDSEIHDNEIIKELKKHNDEIKDFDMKLITTITKKFRSQVSKHAVIEIKSAEYEKLIQIGTLMLPWRECKVVEHIYIKRCFKCCGYSHISKECKSNKQTCSKCAGTHKFSDCQSKKLCCVNCKLANEKYKLKLNVNHHAYSKDCTVLERRMKSIRNKIEYMPTE